MAAFSVSDVTLGLRLMRKQPVLSVTAVLALATGIGLATMGFTFLEAVFTSQLPFAGGDRFVLLDVYEAPRARRAGLSIERFRAVRESVPALSHLGAFETAPQNLLLPTGEVALVSGVVMTPESFAVLPFAPIVGRALDANDAVAGAAPAIVIRESLWRRHFSADPLVVGRSANFSGVQRQIVGVLPDALEFPNSPEAWLPLRDPVRARIFGVLVDVDGLAIAQTQVASASAQFEQANPSAPRLRLQVDGFVPALSRGLDILTGALVFVLVLVLLVIAANVANLILARAMSRSSELAVRSALGATRARLVTQVCTEVLLLGSIAAVVGVAASELTFKWIRETATDMPFWVDLTAGPRTVLFVAMATVLAAAVGGAWPALKATSRDAQQALSASNRRVAGAFGVTSSAMIALQIALSIGALHAALVVAHGVAGYMRGASIAGESQILTARLYLPDSVEAAAHTLVLDTLNRLPGITRAGLATSLPRLSPGVVMTRVRADVRATASMPRAAPRVAVSPGYLETLGGRAITGRLFTAHDLSDEAPPVAIVNEPFVATFFGGANPVGKQLQFVDEHDPAAASAWREIVGVVPDLGLSAGDEQLAGGLYVPMRRESLMYVAAAVAGDPALLAMPLRRAIAQTDPRILVRDTVRLPDVGSEDRAVFAGIGAALTALGVIALGLSVIGVYALLSFSVAARTREIAVRSALGATRVQVLRSVIGRAAIPLAAGALLGPAIGTALIAVRGIFAFRLPSEAGAMPVAALVALMLVAALAAAWLPGRRALRVNVADALKAEH